MLRSRERFPAGLACLVLWTTLIAIGFGPDAALAGEAVAQEPLKPPQPAAAIQRFHLVKSEAIPDAAGGGTLYRYTDGTIRVSVFIYPMRPEDQRDAQGSLAAITTAFLQGFPEFVRRGWYDAFEIAGHQSVSVATVTGSIPGRIAAVATSAGGRPFAEMFYIYAIRNFFVKVRATIPVSPTQKDDSRSFVEELIRTIAAAE